MTDAGVTGLILQRSGPPKTIAATGTVVIEDPRLEDVIAPDAPLLCLYEHATFSEGTVWDAPRQRLVWSDVVGRRVLAWYPDGRVETVVDATAFINGNAVDRDGHLVHCEHGRRCISRSTHEREAEPFLTHFEGKLFNAPNDITLAPDGSLWFSDPTFGLNMPKQGSLREAELDHRSVYRHDPDSGATRRMADFDQPNGLEFSPDGRILYVSDTARALNGDTHEIIAFDVAPDGSLSRRRPFLSVEPGIPDGFVVDERGWIWTTSKTGIQIFAPDGARLGRIPTPNLCANCDLGGVDGRRLFIAAEHMLLAIDLRSADDTHR